MKQEKVITLQNGSKLNEKQFIRYFEKKVLYTIRKFKLLEGIKQRPQVHELFGFKKINTYIISKECLDDISLQILQAMMKPEAKQKLSSLLPKYKKIIRPFYLMSKEEMLLYIKIKKIKNLPQTPKNITLTSHSHFKQSLKTSKNLKLTDNNIQTAELSSFIDELEKQQKNIKNSIVSSLLKLENFIE